MFATALKTATAVIPSGGSHAAGESSALMAALWECEQCQVWWGSQSGDMPEARFLLQLAGPNSHLFPWENYRGWREKLGMAPMCPECGREASFPRSTLLGRAAAHDA